jgi:PAS domain S-box-containing protein
MTVSYVLLSVAVLGAVGSVLYAMIFRTTSSISEGNLKQTTAMIFDLVETSAEVAVRSSLSASAERALDLVADAFSRERSGALSEAAAQREAIRELSVLRIGKTGYAYILDAGGFMVYHPSPGLRGKPAPTENSPLEWQLQRKEGYLEYSWKNPEEAAAEPKALYQLYFAPWRWIIAVTSYRREFDNLVTPVTFSAEVLGLRFGRSGYSYIIGEDGTIIVHPTLKGNPMKETGNPELVRIHGIMNRMREGSLVYTLQNPGDPAPVTKIAYFKWLPRFHWYAVSTLPLAELYQPARAAGFMILLAVLGAALLAALLTAYLAASITRPVEALAARLDSSADGDFSVRMEAASADEIGRLARHFNRFMDGLQASRDRLAASIEERARSEEARALLAAATQQLTELVMITDTSRLIVYVNPAWERVTGYRAAEALGRTPGLLKSGKQDADFYARLDKALEQGSGWEGRVVNRRKDGSQYIQEGTITPIRDETGAVANYVSVSRDVTREVERELRQRQSQKLEAIGTLAGGIAHDFNNILAAIIGFSDLLETGLSPDDPLQEHVRQIVNAGTRARDLVAKILTFSRQSIREARPVRMDVLVRDAIGLLRATLPATIAIRQEIGPDIPVLRADPTEVHQMVMNLCTNAAQAIGERAGTVTVSLRAAARDEPSRPGAGQPVVELAVADDGVGMTEEVMARIFEPFFTTKEAGKGTGIGLAVVHGIVGQMGGEIKVQSAPGKGTVMRVILPVASGLPVAAAVPSSAPPRGRGEHVIIVDDEPSVRSVGARILEALGYRVTAVGRASAALEAVREQPRGFQAVITDQTMPEMTGVELTRELTAMGAGVPVLLMTGQPSADLDAQARAAGVRLVIAKPFRRVEVAAALRQVLDAESVG